MRKTAYRQAGSVFRGRLQSRLQRSHISSATSSARPARRSSSCATMTAVAIDPSWNQRVSADRGCDGVAKARRAGSLLSVALPPRLRDALLAIDRPALPRRRGKARAQAATCRRLSKCLRVLRPEDRSEPGPTPWTPSNIGRADASVCSASSSVPLGLHSLDLLEQQFEPIEFSDKPALRCWGSMAIASSAVQPDPPIATQRLIPGCALREEQSLDPVDVLDPFHDQHLALTANPAVIFIFRRRRLNH